MAVVKKAVLLLWVFVFVCSSFVFADEVSLEERVWQLQKRIEVLEKRISEQDRFIASQVSNEIISARAQLTEGLEIGAGATIIMQGTDNVNNATADVQKKVSRLDATYSADITIGKKFNDIGGEAFLHLEAGKGAGLEDDLTLYSNTNRDAGDSQDNIQVTELWYEQVLLEDQAVFTFGKLDPTGYFDNNEVANDETTQFLGRIFRNSPTIEFPDNSAGIRVAYSPLKWLELGYGVFDGDGDWEKIGDNLFNIGQVALKTNFFDLVGNYRFYGWHCSAYHTKWLETDKIKEAAYGLGLSFDQKLTDITTAFLRYGWQYPAVYNPDTAATGGDNYSLEHSWSAGLQLEGKPWGREKDIFAFAVGQIVPSDDYKKAGSATIASPRAKIEGHLEAYYRIFVNEHLSISPGLQYIWNPFGKDVADDTGGIFVGGMRAQIDF